MDVTKKEYCEEYNALKKEYDEFVYIVSHDLKSPMRAISNITNWIEEDLGENIDTDTKNNFRLLKNRVVRLEKMMSALLELSRVNQLKLDSYEIDLKKLINESIAMCKGGAKAEINLVYNIKQDTVAVIISNFQKVICELLDNALKFHNKEIKNILIFANETESEYEITIQDNGPGIPEEVVDKIFNIFYTVSSKDRLETTGAGLTIIKKIMQKIGGDIKYEPVLPTGSLFRLNWPKNK